MKEGAGEVGRSALRPPLDVLEGAARSQGDRLLIRFSVSIFRAMAHPLAGTDGAVKTGRTGAVLGQVERPTLQMKKRYWWQDPHSTDPRLSD